MSTYEWISVVVAGVALLISSGALFFNGVQTKKGTQALLLDQQLTRANTVMHFTARFFDLVKEGDPFRKLSDEDWAYQFWSLHATEFYFFHHGILPTFMYSLWMIDLAAFYCGTDGQRIRELHSNYLKTYSLNYPEMIAFFNEIYELAKTCSDQLLRNQRVTEFVTSWIDKNKREILV